MLALRQLWLIFSAIALIALAIIYFTVLNKPTFFEDEIKINFIRIPRTIKMQTPVEITWQIKSSLKKEIQHTALRYGLSSIPNPQSLNDYPQSSPVLNGLIPGEYSTAVQFQNSGRIYMRANVIINEINYWSPETVINIVQ